uniref:Uncharacterized protein n=1 Tax=Ixodes ricinus TaxID=34613 RepID=A0A147BEX5_IXORI
MPGWSTSSLWTSAASTGCRCSSTSVRPSAARSWPDPAPSRRRPTRRAASTRPGCAGCCSAEELLFPPRLFGTPGEGHPCGLNCLGFPFVPPCSCVWLSPC